MTNTINRDAPEPPARDGLTLRPLAILVMVALVGVGSVLAYDWTHNPQKEALAPDEGLDALVVPEFSMTTQDGATFTRADLLGRVTVLDFFFTNCPTICPALARSMERIQEGVGADGVRLVSISVDPQHDTQDVLRAHAKGVGADPNVWTFLRAEDFEQVRRVCEDGLNLGLEFDPARSIKTRTGDEMPWITHTGKLVLLDPEARVIGLYSGLDEREVDALIQRLRRALKPE